MVTIHLRSYSSIAAAFLVAAGLAAGLSSPVRADQVLGRTRTAPQGAFSQAQARFIAERLYQTVLGRDGDEAGLVRATSEIQSGYLERQVNGMVTSQEFRDGTARKSSADVLEQFYRGMHRRSPDPTGIALFIPRLDRRAYTGVLMEMLESPEFMATLEREGPAPPRRRGVTVEAVLDCQARVLDAVSDAASGRVFLAFEEAPEGGPNTRVISGVAVDQSEGVRDMTYRCEGDRATFTYTDRRPARGADPRDPIGTPAVRGCLTAAADQMGGARVVGVAMSATDSRARHIIVTGLARKGAVQFSCEMDGRQVLSVRRR